MRKKELTDRIVILKQKVTETESRAHNWLQYTEEAFKFAHDAQARFDDPETPLDEKKGIFMTLGWNYVMKDEKLFISPSRFLIPIAEKRNAVEDEISRLELETTLSPEIQNTPLGVLCPILRG